MQNPHAKLSTKGKKRERTTYLVHIVAEDRHHEATSVVGGPGPGLVVGGVVHIHHQLNVVVLLRMGVPLVVHSPSIICMWGKQHKGALHQLNC